MLITTTLEVTQYEQVKSKYPYNLNQEIHLMGEWLISEKHKLIKSFFREAKDRPVTIIGIVSKL